MVAELNPLALKVRNRLVVLNLSLLICHQIDAAYWQEWEMFAMPGGVQLFTVLNFLIFLPLLLSLESVFLAQKNHHVWANLIAALACVVLPIHAAFALAGYEQFHLPLSIFWIVSSFVGGALQLSLSFLWPRQ